MIRINQGLQTKRQNYCNYSELRYMMGVTIRGLGGRVDYSVGLDWRPGSPGRFRIQLRKRRFGTLVIPFTPLCQCRSVGSYTKSRRSLISGVCAREKKMSHQSALEMCNLSWTPTPTLTPPPHTHSCNKPHTPRDAVTGRNISWVNFRFVRRLSEV